RKDEQFRVGDRAMTGQELRDRMLGEMRAKVAGAAAPYNRLYRPERDGVATTFAGFVAPALGVSDPYRATPEQVRLGRRRHLLLPGATGGQRGVSSLWSWDVVGALRVPEESVRDWVADGDYRWVNRGGVDLVGAAPGAARSAFGMPRARALYGPLPQQLRDP